MKTTEENKSTKTAEETSVSIDLAKAAVRSGNEFFKSSDFDIINESARRYRLFIDLIRKYPDRVVAPTKDIDEMWHIHMLHPVTYYDDCMANFGFILDHDGGYGTASDTEWLDLLKIFSETEELWQREFGEPYSTRKDIHVAAKCVKACRVACTKRPS